MRRQVKLGRTSNRLELLGMLKKYLHDILPSLRKKMMMPRRALGGSIAEYAAVASLFLFLTAAYTNWVVFDISNKIFVGLGGGDATAGFLWLNSVSPGLSPFLGHTDIVNFPYGEDLGSPTHATYALLWIPMRMLAYLFDPVIALNIMTVAGFVITAMTTYWLVKRLTRSTPVALFAGFAATFVPYSLMKGSAHLSYIYAGVFVLIFAAFIGFWLRPTWLRAVLFGLSVAAAFYTDGYYILLAAVMVLSLCVGGAIYELARKHVGALGAKMRGLAISLAVLLLALIPLAYIQLSQGDRIKQSLANSRSDTAKEFQLYRTELIDFIVPVEHPLLAQISKYNKLQAIKNSRSNPSENANYVGVVVAFLVVVGLAFMISHLISRRGTLSKLSAYDRNLFLFVGTISVITTLVFLSFMFSPSIDVAGQTFYLPGQLLLDHDITLWRVMSRFFIPLHVVLVAFAAYTAWILVSVELKRFKLMNATIVTWGVMSVFIALTALEYLTVANRPSFEVKHIPKTYTWLKEQKDIQVIAELPIVDHLNLMTGDYLTHQLVHGKKLINTRIGAGSGTLGYFGTVDNPESLDFIRSRGVDAVVVSGRNCEVSVTWGKLIYSEKVANVTNPMLCTYRLTNMAYDPYFTKTEDGVLGTPLFSETYEQTSVIEKLDVLFMPARFREQQSTPGPLSLSLDFVPVLDPDFNGSWSVYQRGDLIASGPINGSRGSIDITIQKELPVELRLKASAHERFLRHGIGMQNMVVTDHAGS